MKNLLLSLLFMLISSFAFATTTNQSTVFTEVVKTVNDGSFDSNFLKYEAVGTCTVTVRFYNGDGELTGTRIHTFYNVASESDCNSWASAVRLSYVLQEA